MLIYSDMESKVLLVYVYLCNQSITYLYVHSLPADARVNLPYLYYSCMPSGMEGI